MSPKDRALLRKLRRRVNAMAPRLAATQLEAYRQVRLLLTDAELIAALQAGVLDQLLADLLTDEALDGILMPMRLIVDRAVFDAARLAYNDLPAIVRPSAFNMLNPRVIQAARDLDTRVVDRLKGEIRETFMQHVYRGLEEGRHPRSVARSARAVLGLAPNQERAVANFERMLREGDRAALRRTLRDQRFDGILRQALGRGGPGLTEDQIQRMVAAYRRRFLAWNTRVHTRSASLDAHREAQRVQWEEAIASGMVDATDLRRQRLVVQDGRQRDEHQAMHLDVVGFDERYANGELVPGDLSFNCRCSERIFIAQSALRRIAEAA